MGERLGQNFLINHSIASNIVEALNLTPHDSVLEIGPGKGVLTNLILNKTKKVSVVEFDKNLASLLENRFPLSSGLKIFNEDFLKFDLSKVPAPYKLAGNLPYSIATPIIEKILFEKNWFFAVFMVQKEVAQRIIAKPNDSEYGVFSIICQYYASCSLLFSCGPDDFCPKPKVNSSVLLLKNRFSEMLEPAIIKVIKAAFSQRRKTILNAVCITLNIEKNTVLKVLETSGINHALRPQNLSISDYKTLTKNLFL